LSSYPDHPVLLSNVCDWIVVRAEWLPPYYFEGDPSAELKAALSAGSLVAFLQSDFTLTSDWEDVSRWREMVVARESVLELWPKPATEPASEKRQSYTLLWEAAEKMARDDGHTVERNWLVLMDAFWTGDLSPVGLTYFYRDNRFIENSRPIEYSRQLLFAMCTGASTEIKLNDLDVLKSWRVEDYLSNLLYGTCFARDPEGRTGLAVETSEWERYRGGSPDLAIKKGVSEEGPEKLVALPQKGKRGRKPGSGSLDDSIWLHKMLERLAQGAATTAHAAAALLSLEAPGQSPTSTQARLERKFIRRFGDHPPPYKTWNDVLENSAKANSIE